MKVIKVMPDKEPVVININNELEVLQAEVEGFIEFIYPFEEPVGIICNDEGKIMGLPLNRSLYDEDGNIYDIIAGTFLVVGLTEDDICSLTDEQINKYLKMFQCPEFISKKKKV